MSFFRFKGDNDNSKYCIPTKEERMFMSQRTEDNGNNLYRVPSRSEEEKYYTVDMTVGICECFVGRDGSPCAHQYVLWSENVSDSVNFIPYFSKEERQRFARIAMGTALPLSYYENLHPSHERNGQNGVDFVNNTDELSQVKFDCFYIMK